MKYTTALFCLAVIAASAECASIGGIASLDRNGASLGGSVVFPRIPFFNTPMRRIFPSRESSPSRQSSSTSQQSSTSQRSSTSRQSPTTTRPANNINSIRDLFDIPNPRSLVPSLPSSSDSSSFPSIPSIRGLSAVSSQIPGVNAAIQSARNHVQAALNITNDLSSGIEQALLEAFNSSNPTAAVRTLVGTVLNAYITAAENCPLLVIGSRVLQDGINLAAEIAQVAANVIFGTTSTSSTTTDSTSTSTDATSTSTDATSTSTDATSTSTDATSTSTDATSTSTDATSTSTEGTSTT